MRHGSIQSSARRLGGFTLIEILIVVIILGILASIVIPQFAKASGDSSNATFVHDIKLLARLVAVQQHQSGSWPVDQAPGVYPPELVGKVDPGDWTQPTPLGGRWDMDAAVFGVTAGVSVYLPDRTPAQMIEVDRMIDDGDLTTGAFRQRVDGYIYILAE